MVSMNISVFEESKHFPIPFTVKQSQISWRCCELHNAYCSDGESFILLSCIKSGRSYKTFAYCNWSSTVLFFPQKILIESEANVQSRWCYVLLFSFLVEIRFGR